jgi:hypothetical protein
MPLRAITITAYRRPHLFAAMLKTLLANEVTGWRILVVVEPSSVADEIAGVAEKLLHSQDVSLTVNAKRLGIKTNPFQLIERAFAEGAQIILHLEEDLLLAPDATQLALWYEANHRPEWLCLGLLAGGCGSTGLISNPDYPDLLFAGHTFNSLGFAVRHAEWERHMRSAWMTEPARILRLDGARTAGWDWSVFKMLTNNPQLRTLQPVLARATHNGRLEGEYCTPEFHDAAFARLPIFDGAAATLVYRVQPLDLLPSVVRNHARLWFEMTCAMRALHDKPQSWRRQLGRWRLSVLKSLVRGSD